MVTSFKNGKVVIELDQSETKKLLFLVDSKEECLISDLEEYEKFQRFLQEQLRTILLSGTNNE